MPVGTGAISLNEVRLELGLPSNVSLQDCIDNANSSGYDATYYSAPATSLAEFRGYNDTVAGNSLRVTPSTISNPANASTDSISVVSNTTYNVSDNASWITTSISSGSNNTTFNVVSASNGTGSPRSGSVTVSTSSGSPSYTRTISVSQRSGFE
jgi:hypothetical protein